MGPVLYVHMYLVWNNRMESYDPFSSIIQRPTTVEALRHGDQGHASVFNCCERVPFEVTTYIRGVTRVEEPCMAEVAFPTPVDQAKHPGLHD